MSSALESPTTYTDLKGLESLRRKANKNADAALREVTKQFEALFIQQMLKNMREAKLDDGLFDSDQGDFYLDMHDKQLALSLSEGQGMGLADMLYEQLKHTVPQKAAPDEAGTASAPPAKLGNLDELAPRLQSLAQKVVAEKAPPLRGTVVESAIEQSLAQLKLSRAQTISTTEGT